MRKLYSTLYSGERGGLEVGWGRDERREWDGGGPGEG